MCDCDEEPIAISQIRHQACERIARPANTGPPQRSRAHEGKQVLVEGVGIDLGEAVAPPLSTFSCAPWTIFAVFSAEAAIGTIWSSSPWMTSVGLSIFLRSVV